MIGSIVAAVVFVVLVSVVGWLCVRHRAIKKVALGMYSSYRSTELAHIDYRYTRYTTDKKHKLETGDGPLQQFFPQIII